MQEYVFNAGKRMVTYEERMKELEKRGIDTSIFLSDWCVSCGYLDLIQSYKTKDADGKNIRIGVCATGCNGLLQFDFMPGDNARRFLPDKQQSRIRPVLMKNEKGEIIQRNVPVPLFYEEEIGVEL